MSIVFGSDEAQRVVQANRTLAAEVEPTCCVATCGNPPDGLDDLHCQEHWESLADAMWWGQVRAAAFATAAAKNAKALPSVTKFEVQP